MTIECVIILTEGHLDMIKVTEGKNKKYVRSFINVSYGES